MLLDEVRPKVAVKGAARVPVPVRLMGMGVSNIMVLGLVMQPAVPPHTPAAATIVYGTA